MDTFQLPIESMDSIVPKRQVESETLPAVPPPVNTTALVDVAEPTATVAAVPAVPIINYDIVPSLRGTVARDPTLGPVGANIRIKGLWAMVDSQHGQEGMTSEFELTLLETFTPANILILQGADHGEIKETALSGKYKGWFRLKRASGNGSDQIAERDVILSFNRNTDGGMEVDGEGSNKYGNYVLKGNMDADQRIVMYRQYVIKVGGQPPATTPRGSKAKKVGSAKSKSSSATKTTREVKAKVPREEPQGTTNQRDGAGRERKKSAVMAGAYAVGVKTDGVTGADSRAMVVEEEPGPQRAQRLSQQLIRCGELLTALSKLPSAFFFLEPVDPIALGIPDYYDQITTPMDFSTVKTKLFNYEYGGTMDFAADVRLVFRNAITYNQMRDNPVHIAAREMSTKFEEKFRILNATSSTATPAELAAYQQRLARTTKSKSKPAKRAPMMQALPPDGSMVAMQEMQQRMLDMQSEISRLRTTVSHDQVVGQLDYQQAEAQNPLTYVEKKSLISDIHSLAPEHMNGVIDIVSAATPDNGDEDIEVPLDELDTATLRSLQRYVANIKGASQPKPKAVQAKPQPIIPPQASAQVAAPQGGGGFGTRPPAVVGSTSTVEMESDLFFAPDEEYVNAAPANASAWSTSAAQNAPVQAPAPANNVSLAAASGELQATQ